MNGQLLSFASAWLRGTTNCELCRHAPPCSIFRLLHCQHLPATHFNRAYQFAYGKLGRPSTHWTGSDSSATGLHAVCA